MFKRKNRILAVIICMALILASLPISAFADRLVPDVTLTEGDIAYGFAPSEAECSSSDPSVAWIDSDGNLNALKAGTATVSVPGKGDFTVSINDYTDGSEVIGNLKILARYNDSMQFYDGHVYLLFTSYQDGVVPGGVCFNRELYNQKLEWDQFENVTYELDITKNQFDTMMMYLNGNLNKFSILKNSCATVALRAWNAAIGSRNGEDTAYKLSYAGFHTEYRRRVRK